MGAYMRRIGYDEAPNAAGAAELSLAIAYRYVYQDLPDLKERLDQEAVAHMLELHANNQLLPHEIGPVEDIVKAIRDGRFSRQQQPLFSIGQSMRRDLDADGRPAPEPHDPRPIEADMAAVDRMNRMAELVGACRA